MSLLVTGSIGIDTVTTPFGTSENCLGGSAIYFSMAASYFCPVRFSGVVGMDCPFNLAETFKGRDVDLSGLEIRQGSKTFRWKGSYHNTMKNAITDNVELNVLMEKPAKVPIEFMDSKFVFLANTSPVLQMEILDQLDSPVFVAADTMNCWIDGHLEDLKKLMSKINALIINEDEARSITKESNLIITAEKILEMGPDVVIIKKGEYGSMMCNKDGDIFVLPAYIAREVKDPTGAGDSFAGAFMGYLTKQGKVTTENLKKAIAYGTVMASFTISDFSLAGLTGINSKVIESRFEKLREITQF